MLQNKAHALVLTKGFWAVLSTQSEDAWFRRSQHNKQTNKQKKQPILMDG